MIHESKILNVTLRRPRIHFVPDVVYAQMSMPHMKNKLLQADLLMPQTTAKLPAVIFVPGGGFVGVNKTRMLQLRMHLAENNFVVASIDYRTAPDAIFPQPIEDVKSAIRFFKAHAERFSIDAEKIFLIGDSAGGYLAAFAAVTNGDKIFNVGDNLDVSSKISAAVDLYGLSDLTQVAADFPADTQSKYYSAGAVVSLFVNGLPDFGGVDGGILAHPLAAEKANPINYINKNSAPMLLMHGSEDDVVSPAQTDLLFQALKNRGVEAQRYIIPHAKHSDDYWQQEEVFDTITDFLTQHL